MWFLSRCKLNQINLNYTKRMIEIFWSINQNPILIFLCALFSYYCTIFNRHITLLILLFCTHCRFFQAFDTSSGCVCVCGLSFCAGCHGLLPQALQLSLDRGWTCSPLCQQLVSAGWEGREIITCWNPAQAQLQYCGKSFPVQGKMTYLKKNPKT